MCIYNSFTYIDTYIQKNIHTHIHIHVFVCVYVRVLTKRNGFHKEPSTSHHTGTLSRSSVGVFMCERPDRYLMEEDRGSGRLSESKVLCAPK